MCATEKLCTSMMWGSADVFSSFRAEFVRWIWCLKFVGFVVFMAYIALPLFMRANSWVIPRIIFKATDLVRWPSYVNHTIPTDFGLNSTRNFYFNVEKGIRIGAWHTIPPSLSGDRNVPWDEYESLLVTDKPVFLYLHGNGGSRGKDYRVEMIKFLSRLDGHVLTIDYRGFGDSSGSFTEEGVVQDAMFAYKWLKEKTKNAPIFVWGHSLGSGISTSLSRKLCDEGDPPLGLILEAPFNNIVDSAIQHPLASVFRWVPGFSSFMRDSLAEYKIYFSSDKSITRVTSHILILHAEDDVVVPYNLGMKLYHAAKNSRSSDTKDVQFVSFESHHGYGHKNISQAPELKGIVLNFMEKCYSDW